MREKVHNIHAIYIALRKMNSSLAGEFLFLSFQLSSKSFYFQPSKSE